jgi:hypothetical protein
MKVVEFFKLYNIALGLNSKTQSLQLFMLTFQTKMEFKSPFSLPT